MNKLLPVILVGVAAGAAGFGLGDKFGPRPASAGSAGEATSRSLPPPVSAPLRRFDLTNRPKLDDVASLLEQALESGRWIFNKQWEIIVNSLEAPDIPPLLAVVARHPKSSVAHELRRSLYSRWAECNPRGALAHAGEQKEATLRDHGSK